MKAADGNYEPLINTLTEQGPYVYTILPEVKPDGSVKLPILTTREEIAEAYAMIRGVSDLLEVTGLTEIRGSWYLFQDNISRGQPKGARPGQRQPHAGALPVRPGHRDHRRAGLVTVPREMLGPPGESYTAAGDPLRSRAQVFDNYSALPRRAPRPRHRHRSSTCCTTVSRRRYVTT